jgi:PPOX class probable F420-dependent enzyme
LGKPLPESAKRILDGQNLAHVATIMPDGSPQVSPVWVYRHDDYVMISTGADRQKTRNLERDPRVALSIAPADRPYPPLQIRGRVVEIIRGEEAADGFVEVSRKYGNANPQRPDPATRVVYKIEALSIVAPQG